MITPPRDINQHLASFWTAGVAVLFLGVGMSGAWTPLVTFVPVPPPPPPDAEIVMFEPFEPEAAFAEVPEENPEAPPEEASPVEEMEIPPVPEITPPLSPPEMAEITPLEQIVERPKPAPSPPPQRPAPPRPRPNPAPSRPAATPGAAGGTPGAQFRPAGTPSGTGKPSVVSGNGKGKFPQPSYPSAARREGRQGSVQISVTVEASGLPASVSVARSSGHADLDAAARDQVQRRWRWPAGGVRRFVVPVRFVLK